MSIPTASTFPVAFDSNQNLFLVHDALRVNLLQDYNPGDASILTDGDTSGFPPTGIITLTEQCSDIDFTAISFYYSSVNATGFFGLQLLPGFTDVVKPKVVTDVTMNVMAETHNNQKNALIAIEGFCGVKGTTDTMPFGPTLEGRINFLRNLVLVPRAWFTATPLTGIVPLTVTFTNESFRLATDNAGNIVTCSWDFGDETVSLCSPDTATGCTIVEHTYCSPGIFSPTITVTNEFGTDVLTFNNMIQARVAAPDPAAVQYDVANNQLLTPGTPPAGPYTTPPLIRSAVNQFITFEIPPGVNPNSHRSYAGELLDGNGRPIDPVSTYTWSLGDDLVHPSAPMARASYSIGGLYDLILRADTAFGAYRITVLPNSIDIIESTNLWLWNYVTTTQVQSYEFGLLSETFKIKANSELTVTANDDFLQSAPNAAQQIREFHRNTGFAPRSLLSSGQGGSCLLCNASGRLHTDPLSAERINIVEYNGFSDVYDTSPPNLTRPWNWAFLGAPASLYFILGYPTTAPLPNTSFTNQNIDTLNLSTLTDVTSTLNVTNYLSGAQELMSNLAQFDNSGNNIYGDFSGYRTCWKGQTGYIVRNSGVGPFYRLKSFYRTEGTVASVFTNIRKLADIAGTTKTEGQLVPLASGIFFFDNSGAISAYNETSGIWETAGPGANSAAFQVLQDPNVPDFDSLSNTLLVASDGDRIAYLSFDYSSNAFIKFNATDATFSSLGARPQGTQWILGIF